MTAPDLADRCRRLLPATTDIVAAAFACRRLDDSDTWWHLAAGRWIATNRMVPLTDTLSFTVQDHPWINLQWLYDVTLYGLYRLGGADLLVLAATLAFGAAIWLLTRNLRLSLGSVATAVIGLWAILVVEERFFIRPEMVSFVLLQALLWLLLTARRSEGRRLWLLVPLMLIWVNCHSLFILGLFCIACAAAAPFAARLPLLPPGWRYQSQLGSVATQRLVIASIAATAATLLNPYGLDGLLFPLKLLSRIDSSQPVFQSIAEFHSPFSGYLPTISIGAYQIFFITGVFIVGLAFLLSLARPVTRRGVKPAGVDLASLAVFAGLAYLSVLARRNTAIFMLGVAPAVAVCASVLEAKLPRRARRATEHIERWSAPVILLGCVALVVLVTNNFYYRWNRITHEFGLGTLEVNFPLRAAAFAREMGMPPNLYNDLTAGGYLTWDAPVDGGVFIDGRLEVYDTAFFSSYIDGLIDGAAWERQANQLGVNTALIFHRWSSRRQLVRWLLRNPRWAIVYHDATAVIFLRAQGHDQLIAKSRQRFAAWYRETLNALRSTPAGWRWPVAHAEALESYADLLLVVGRPDTSMQLYSQLLDLGLLPWREASTRLKIARHRAATGDADGARAQLEKAAARDPSNARVQALLARLSR